VENRGQTDRRVRYYAQGSRHAFFLTRDELVLSLLPSRGAAARKSRGLALALRFRGANPQVVVQGRERALGYVNYLVGTDRASWRTRLPRHAQGLYKNLWPGVDMKLGGRRGTLKHEFRVRPGARVGDIRLAYRGATGLALDGAGALEIRTALGPLRDSRPVAYQQIGGVRMPVPTRYVLGGGRPDERSYGFAVGAGYRPDRELVIDPGLDYSTFLGGTSHEDGAAIAVDASGNAYVTGFTQSPNFPTTPGAFDRTGAAGNNRDAFVSKLNATGTALVYSTRLGGADNDPPSGVAVDAGGNALIGGSTRSADFPTTPGAFDTTHNGGAFDELFDLFVTKLNATGSALVYSTFLGGSKSDFTAGFAVDAARNAYVVGSTLSPDLPTTPGAFDSAFAGSEGFVAKLNATGSGLVYSTFLGEAGASAVAPDTDGNAWLAGGTGSPSAATTPDASDRQFNGGPSDAYVAKLNATGSALLFATFLGGSESEGAGDVALDSAGDVYVTGQTISADFPTTPGAFDRVFNGDPSIFWGDAFMVKIAFGSGAPAPPPPPPPVPAAPALVSPAEGAVVAQPVTFDWTDVAEAASYTIQVDEISEFGAPLILTASATASQFTTSSLPDGNWFWRVRAVNSAGTPGAWSAVRAIQVESAPPPPPPPTPGAPSLVSPAENAVVAQPITFDWSDVAAAAWYTIEVDDASSFAAPLVWAATSTPSELATNSLPNGTLFWRVRAFNSDGVGGPFSAVRTVQVQASAPPPPPPPGPLPAPSLLSPAHDARFSPGQSITFDWSDVSAAASYTIQIDDSENFSAPLTVDQTTAASQFTTSTLPTIRMWWRVRANDASGAPGNWSPVRRFEVKT
jgi:Beta-propeller repeat